MEHWPEIGYLIHKKWNQYIFISDQAASAPLAGASASLGNTESACKSIFLYNLHHHGFS